MHPREWIGRTVTVYLAERVPLTDDDARVVTGRLEMLEEGGVTLSLTHGVDSALGPWIEHVWVPERQILALATEGADPVPAASAGTP